MPRKTKPIKVYIPKLALHLAVIGLVLSWVPIVLLLEYRTRFDSKPPIHFFHDMDNQPKLKAQAENDAFADSRAMRPRLAGTVARGELWQDDHFYRGFKPVAPGSEAAEGDEPQWYTGYPAAITVDRALLVRGRERYDIFCAPCHGIAGRGNGMVNKRAVDGGAQALGWVEPKNLHEKNPETGKLLYGRELYPDGKMFNTITHGKSTMRGYASMITAEDRWAIIAHIRALQLALDAPDALMPERPVADEGDTPDLSAVDVDVEAGAN